MTGPADVSPEAFAEIVDQSAGGPQYRELIGSLRSTIDKMQVIITRQNWVLALLIVLGVAFGLGYASETASTTRLDRRAVRIDAQVTRAAAVSAAANSVEVVEHRIANEVAHACQAAYLREVAEAFARRDAAGVLAASPCPVEDLPALQRELEEVEAALRALDPDHPFIRGR